MTRLKAYFRLLTHVQLLPILENGEETTLIGGQAVMEGVMMRSPHHYCVAVRKPDGTVVTQEDSLTRLSDVHPLLKWPVVRGLATLGHAMWLGMRALRFSAECALGTDGPVKKKNSGSNILQIGFSIAFMLAIYKLIPLYLATVLGNHIPALHGRFAVNTVDGLLRIAIFLVFMFSLSRLKDMRRVFEYHGAEHKVVFNFESGQPVTVENAQKFVTWHPRCGTSFLMVVLILSMVLYAFLPVDNFWLKLAARIILLPLVIGLSYEIIRFAARHQRSLAAWLTRPGLWLQRITTKPPTDGQAEVAILALQRAMDRERIRGGLLVIG